MPSADYQRNCISELECNLQSIRKQSPRNLALKKKKETKSFPPSCEERRERLSEMRSAGQCSACAEDGIATVIKTTSIPNCHIWDVCSDGSIEACDRDITRLSGLTTTTVAGEIATQIEETL